ncbi:MAG TPA: CRISPR-associated helicase Cas3' [Candidatus Deferrimicrobiaceae bacterium]
MLWAKSRDDGFHPLLLHLIEVAACADAILDREPAATRERMGGVLGLSWEQARPWILTLIANHDIGKAFPGFQFKRESAEPFLSSAGFRRLPPPLGGFVHHGAVGQVVLSDLLAKRGWPEEMSHLIADAVTSHHGIRPSSSALERIGSRVIGDRDWSAARQEIFDLLMDLFGAIVPPIKQKMSGPDFMLLAGLTSFADWIGSNEIWFSYGTPKDCEDPLRWLAASGNSARKALDAIGWAARTPLITKARSFESIFELSPRPLQQAIVEAVGAVSGPALFLLEAPMGEGKTEAAFHAYIELQRRFGHRGLYVALPTKATGNAMFHRTHLFLKSFGSDRRLDLQLLHGGTLLNEEFQGLKEAAIDDPELGGGVRAGEWFTRKKRALLSEYGVGTVDQALLTILPVRHQFVRLWGLANRVVVIDEIHAYDAYTGTLLIHLVRWLLALGSSVILLSATLPSSIRKKFAETVEGKGMSFDDVPYPRLSVFRKGETHQIPLQSDPARRTRIEVARVGPDLLSVKASLEERLVFGGYGLALMNTVQRSQDLYRSFPEGEPIVVASGKQVGKYLEDGTAVFLFHARYPGDERQNREEAVVRTFGNGGDRSGRKILVATQVVEQSLDLDFDVIVSDLAPIDLLLQRAGRLWRHQRDGRPVNRPALVVSGLAGEEPPCFGGPLWWGSVYREDLLLSTWIALHLTTEIILPDAIEPMVRAIYEEEIIVPESMRERMDKARLAEGIVFAQCQQAHQAIIGRPDDASWDDPGRWVRADEDDPGIHPALVAQTRLGEPSILAVPLFPPEGFDPNSTPDFETAKRWFMRGVSISRKGIVRNLKDQGVPAGWNKSSLLRNAYPMLLDDIGQWQSDQNVRLDQELGLVYGTKKEES